MSNTLLPPEGRRVDRRHGRRQERLRRANRGLKILEPSLPCLSSSRLPAIPVNLILSPCHAMASRRLSPHRFFPLQLPVARPRLPPLSAASCRRRQNRRSSSSPTVAAFLVPELPSPSRPSSHPFPTVFQQSVGNLNALPSPPPSIVSSIPDEAPIGPVGPSSLSATVFSVESSLMIQPSSVVLPDSECIGDPSFSNFQPYPAGPSSCSSASPSGLGIRPGALETVVCSFGPQAPIMGSTETAGLPVVHPHSSGVIVSSSAHPTANGRWQGRRTEQHQQPYSYPALHREIAREATMRWHYLPTPAWPQTPEQQQ